MWKNILAAILPAYLVYFVISTWWKRRHLPPGPYPLPILGNLLTLGADPRKPLMKLWNKYGDVFTVFFGSKPVIILNGYDTIKETFVTHGQVFSDRPTELTIFKDLNKGLGK